MLLIRDNNLIKKWIQKRWNLDHFIEKASQREDIGQQVKEMKDEHKIAKVYQRPPINRRDHQYGGGKSGKEQGMNMRASGKNQVGNKPGTKCDYCRKIDLHKPGLNCPAYGKQCLKWQINHFAICCKSSTTEKPGLNNKAKDQQRKISGKQIKKATGDVE